LQTSGLASAASVQLASTDLQNKLNISSSINSVGILGISK
jgi:hypothetical protein